MSNYISFVELKKNRLGTIKGLFGQYFFFRHLGASWAPSPLLFLVLVAHSLPASVIVFQEKCTCGFLRISVPVGYTTPRLHATACARCLNIACSSILVHPPDVGIIDDLLAATLMALALFSPSVFLLALGGGRLLSELGVSSSRPG